MTTVKRCRKASGIVLLLGSLLGSAAALLGAELVPVPRDPAGYAYGFARGHWAAKLGKVLVFFGDSHNPRGNNSIRVYDPRSNAWEYLWPNNARDGVQNRDNFASFYVAAAGAQGELWVWGGSGLETYRAAAGVEAYRAGRFDLATRTWAARSVDLEALAAVVADIRLMPADPAMAWCDDRDVGVVFGGSVEGNAVDLQYVVERNPRGTPRYRMTPFTGPRPPARDQVTNAGVCAAGHFYVYGGFRQESRPDGGLVGVHGKDLWKFDIGSRKWTQLASGGPGGYQSVMTYDSRHGALVVYGNGHLWAYSLAGAAWTDVTPANLPRIFNHAGVYAPVADLHVYLGGNRMTRDAESSYTAFGVRLTTPPS